MSRDYWIGKNNNNLKKQLKKSEKLKEELDREYESSKKRLCDRVIIFYGLLNSITLKDALSHLNESQLLDFKREISYYLTDDIPKQWENQLMEYKDRIRVSKLETILVDIKHELEKLSYKEYNELLKLTEDIYSDTRLYNLYEISKMIGFTKIYNEADLDKIKLLQDKGWSDDSLNLKERIYNRNNKIYNFLNKRIIQIVKSNQNEDRLINDLTKRFNMSKYRAGQLVATESVYYISNSQREVYKELDVEKYQIIATLDDRTSDICIDMDLTIFNLSDFSAGITAPPFHPWCRTVTIPYFDDNYTERFARDNKGNVYTIDKDISYKEWKSKYVR